MTLEPGLAAAFRYIETEADTAAVLGSGRCRCWAPTGPGSGRAGHRLALAQRRGPQETLEFVARRLAYGDGGIATNWNIGADFEHLRGHDFMVLLGTPIYLAYVD